MTTKQNIETSKSNVLNSGHSGNHSEPGIGDHLKKIYLLEKSKAHFISTCNYASYKKSCQLQEMIIAKIRSPEFQKRIPKGKNPELRILAEKIRKQVEINQVLLDDIRSISREYLSPFTTGYYDQGGNMKKTAKVFSTDI